MRRVPYEQVAQRLGKKNICSPCLSTDAFNNSSMKNCPVCLHWQDFTTLKTCDDDSYLVKCLRCGEFRVDREYAHFPSLPEDIEKIRHLLSGFLRHKNLAGAKDYFVKGKIDYETARIAAPKDTRDSYPLILQQLLDLDQKGYKTWAFQPAKDYPIGYCRDAEDFRHRLNDMQKEDLIVCESERTKELRILPKGRDLVADAALPKKSQVERPSIQSLLKTLQTEEAADRHSVYIKENYGQVQFGPNSKMSSEKNETSIVQNVEPKGLGSGFLFKITSHPVIAAGILFVCTTGYQYLTDGFPFSKAEHASKAEPSTVSITAPSADVPILPRTLEEHFDTDFPRAMRLNQDIDFSDQNALGPGNILVRTKLRVIQEFESNAKFLGLYIPRSNYTYDICVSFAETYQPFVTKLETELLTQSKTPGDFSPVISGELVFSRRVYIYYEGELTLEQLGKLEALYKSKNLSPIFRGDSYATSKWMQERLANAKL